MADGSHDGGKYSIARDRARRVIRPPRPIIPEYDEPLDDSDDEEDEIGESVGSGGEDSDEEESSGPDEYDFTDGFLVPDDAPIEYEDGADEEEDEFVPSASSNEDESSTNESSSNEDDAHEDDDIVASTMASFTVAVETEADKNFLCEANALLLAICGASSRAYPFQVETTKLIALFRELRDGAALTPDVRDVLPGKLETRLRKLIASRSALP